MRGSVTSVFIVGLPGRDMGVLSIAPRQHLHDAAAFLAISVVTEAIVATRPEAAHMAILSHGQHVRDAIQHPSGRGCSRGAEHDLQPCRAQNLDRAIQPVEGEFARRGLDP